MSTARGNLKILQWLREEGCPWDCDTCTKAAAYGYLTLLIWALANDCTWDGELSDVADANGYGYIRGWVKNNVWRTTSQPTIPVDIEW
ncbi:conserved unknown protein [Ectocarpus siliculosus]|uniref:Ankyrin repeat protein n=1 Tax=Ectocarpus siliculosus TaxID=2880 RepID=D7G801_ECTSI|nr:conserved unknown protein [Ectocarpus siliculosus]|eukprot:CBJ27876.1 conserved unknown protein [Ectocarpus siliculosus]